MDYDWQENLEMPLGEYSTGAPKRKDRSFLSLPTLPAWQVLTNRRAPATWLMDNTLNRESRSINFGFSTRQAQN